MITGRVAALRREIDNEAADTFNAAYNCTRYDQVPRLAMATVS